MWARAVGAECDCVAPSSPGPQDAIRFDAFLKENDKVSFEAVRVSEREAKVKLDKLGEIKRIKHAVGLVESETSKLVDRLTDYERFKGVRSPV